MRTVTRDTDKEKATVVGRPFLHAGWVGHPTTLCGSVSRGVATVRDLNSGRPGCPACVRLVNERIPVAPSKHDPDREA